MFAPSVVLGVLIAAALFWAANQRRDNMAKTKTVDGIELTAVGPAMWLWPDGDVQFEFIEDEEPYWWAWKPEAFKAKDQSLVPTFCLGRTLDECVAAAKAINEQEARHG